MRVQGEVVLDMFGGIGYWSLPCIQEHAPKELILCDWNSESVKGFKLGLYENFCKSFAEDPPFKCLC